MKNAFLIALLTFAYTLGFGQTATATGKWTTIDDKTNKKKSIVELTKTDGKLYGKIIHLYPREGREDNPKCKVCSDDRKDQPILGMQIVRGLSWNGEEWEGGTILDPENGKVYKVKIWVDKDSPDKLNVRGYAGPFYRTQTWVRDSK